MTPASLTPEQLLAEYPPAVQQTALRLRAFLRAALPDAEERVYPGWRALGYRDPQAGYVCGVFPQSDHVRLLFEHGASLPDPDRLFTGGGRQTRYLEIRDDDPLPADGIRRLLAAAVLLRAVR